MRNQTEGKRGLLRRMLTRWRATPSVIAFGGVVPPIRDYPASRALSRRAR
jgi:hypothetical protein